MKANKNEKMIKIICYFFVVSILSLLFLTPTVLCVHYIGEYMTSLLQQDGFAAIVMPPTVSKIELRIAIGLDLLTCMFVIARIMYPKPLKRLLAFIGELYDMACEKRKKNELKVRKIGENHYIAY